MSKKIKLKIMRLPHAADMPLPAYQSAGAAGLDLMAAVPEDAPLVLAPGQRANVPTGLSIALPRGTEGQVRPRSGLAARNGITVLNAPGTVDSDYRGEILSNSREFGQRIVSGHARPADRPAGHRARLACTNFRAKKAEENRTGDKRLWVYRTYAD